LTNRSVTLNFTSSPTPIAFGGVQLGRVLPVDEDFGPYRATGFNGRI
jgi:hypothetical protein